MKGTDCKSFSLLVLRLVLAFIFLWHGLQKLMNVEGTMNFFASLPLLPGFLGPIVGVVEVAAGVAFLTGFFWKYAAWAIVIIMVGALLFVQIPGAIANGVNAGFTRDLMILAGGLIIISFGVGKYSLQK